MSGERPLQTQVPVPISVVCVCVCVCGECVCSDDEKIDVEDVNEDSERCFKTNFP